MKSCDLLNTDAADGLRFVGFGIRHPRFGVEQIIPNIHGGGKHYSVIFNHEALKITVDGAPAELPPSTQVVWDQSCRVFYGEPDTRWRLSWLQFGGKDADALLDEYAVPLNQPIHLGSGRSIDNHWMPLLEEFNSCRQLYMPLIRNYIGGILLEGTRILKSAGQSKPEIPESFLQIFHFMNDNYAENMTLGELARKMHLAPVYFSRKFKEYFGLSPIDYIIALRLQEAALYLRSPNLRVQEIAELVGYKDEFHFSRLFKRHFGVSPQSFRDKLHS